MARHLITSALPYINGIKHLGNMVGSMLPADVYSRYLRQRGHDVLYICATDEHGTPAELAAKEAGLPVDEFCAQAHDAQKAVYDGFALAFDYFGRSSSAQNRRDHPALRAPPQGERLHRGARDPPGLLARRRPLPAGPLHRRHLPALRLRQGPRRPVRELHPRPGPDRPDRPALGDQRQHATWRSARPSTSSSSSRSWPHEVEAWIDAHERRVAAPSPPPSPASGSPRASRTARSPATWTGACRCRPTPGRSWPPRARSSTSGSTPRSSTSGRPRSGRTPRPRETRDWKSWWYEADETSATPSSWPRTTSRSTR